jgi:hypothetical protein
MTASAWVELTVCVGTVVGTLVVCLLALRRDTR